MIEDLARMVLETQRIHEESYIEEQACYYIEVDEAVRLAGDKSGLDVRANGLVRLLIKASWADAGNWAHDCLQKQMFANECADCVFIGSFHKLDLFFHADDRDPHIVVKCHDYVNMYDISVAHLLKVGTNSLAQPLRRAMHLAKQQGFIKE